MNRRMTILGLAAALGWALLSAGCMTPTQWRASVTTDQFTDVTTKTVALDFASGLYGWNKNELFISSRTNELIVGIKNNVGMPVGTVQIRVDDSPAWTISPDETPLYMAPSLPKSAIISTNVQEDIASGMSKLMSPFTATTGNKARQIIKQMAAGRTVIFRSIGVNQAASTTGQVKIDASFSDALKQIGIDPSSL